MAIHWHLNLLNLKYKNSILVLAGLKTSFLYFLRDQLKSDPDFINKHLSDICASYQQTIVEILLEKILLAVRETGIKTVTLSGGVSANSSIRKQFSELKNKGIDVYIPKIKFTTDNAAMIAIVGYYKYLKNEYSNLEAVPYARFTMG